MTDRELKPVQVCAFACRAWDFQETIINALSPGKARYEYLLEARDSWPDMKFADIKVRKVGVAHSSEAFKRNAAYRGMPDIRCGEEVSVHGARGVIVGHNDSANFDVLFLDGAWEGATLNVHPSEVVRAAAELGKSK